MLQVIDIIHHTEHKARTTDVAQQANIKKPRCNPHHNEQQQPNHFYFIILFQHTCFVMILNPLMIHEPDRCSEHIHQLFGKLDIQS